MHSLTHFVYPQHVVSELLEILDVSVTNLTDDEVRLPATSGHSGRSASSARRRESRFHAATGASHGARSTRTRPHHARISRLHSRMLSGLSVLPGPAREGCYRYARFVCLPDHVLATVADALEGIGKM